MLAFLGLNLPPIEQSEVPFYYGMGIVLAAAGLFAVEIPLKQSKTALSIMAETPPTWSVRFRAFGICAVIVAAATAAAKYMIDFHPQTLGAISSMLSVFAIITLSMVFNQFRSVPRWRSILTPVMFVLSGLAAGALMATEVFAALILMAVLSAFQVFYIFWNDRLVRKTGNDRDWRGRFIFEDDWAKSARSRKRILRWVGFVFLALIPLPLFWFANLSFTLIYVVFALHCIGLVIYRWLFFVEAEFMPVRA
ncbi:MAG: hypothetical protein AAFR98_04835 [Pseudomonadota bacterium]